MCLGEGVQEEQERPHLSKQEETVRRSGQEGADAHQKIDPLSQSSAFLKPLIN